MHKKVLKSVIHLMWLFIIGFCVLKIFFPEKLLLVIENEKVLLVGKFIDENWSMKMAADVLLGLLTYHFYLCACKQCKKLQNWQYFVLAAYMILIEIGYMWNPTVATILDLAALISFPVVIGSKLGQSIPIFFIHHIGQLGLLYIRSAPLYMVDNNYATLILLVLDGYCWLMLYYLYSNLHKEETIWESLVGSFSKTLQKLSSKKNSQK